MSVLFIHLWLFIQHSQWCYLTISSSAALFSFCFQSFPASGSFFTSGGNSIGVSASASVLPVNIQGWSPWRLIGLISLLSKGLSRIFSSTTIWKYRFSSLLNGPIYGIYLSVCIKFQVQTISTLDQLVVRWLPSVSALGLQFQYFCVSWDVSLLVST